MYGTHAVRNEPLLCTLQQSLICKLSDQTGQLICTTCGTQMKTAIEMYDVRYEVLKRPISEHNNPYGRNIDLEMLVRSIYCTIITLECTRSCVH